MIARYSLGILILLSALPHTEAWSQEVFRAPIVTRSLGTPALGGAALFDTDVYLGESGNPDQLPLFLYEGKHVFAYGNSLGLNAVSTRPFSLGLIARARFAGVDPKGIPELEGLEERKGTLEGGVTSTVRTPIGELSATAVRDVIGRYDGREIDLSYRLPLVFERWSLTPWVSVLFQDERLTNYYYGVSDDEARPGRPAYSPGEAQNLAYGLNASFDLTKHIVLFANVGVEEFDDTIVASPIVEESSNSRALVGGTWVFGGEPPPSRSERREGYDGPPLWSWRVHWAYQLKHNIVPLPVAGVATPSRLTPDIVPTQFGLTLSRALRTSKRADLFARAAVLRHFEEPFQDNFNSYTLSMAGVVKTYSNFTDRVNFRWGLGFGLSYVESIPGQEVQLFVNRNVDSSRLLVYLEMSADFPLDRMIRSDALKGCFVGLIITHRSGAFGGSELLGGVSGGADWGGIHLECLR